MARRPIIFDCDGVLVDSEPLSWEAWRRIAELCGIEITDDAIRSLTGLTSDAVYDALEARDQAGVIWERGRFMASLRALMATILSERLETFEDGEDTAEHLHKIGYRLAVASSSHADRLDLSLRITEIRGLFEQVISGDMVERGKPAPDIYLAAADALRVDPITCTAVEDSPAGISSAKAAGMYVIAVNRGLFASADIGHADVVVPRLTPAVFLG